MTFTDPIGDMFSRIRNGQMRSLNSVEIPSSILEKYLRNTKNEGYIKDYFIEKTENNIKFKNFTKVLWGQPSYKRN